MPIATRWGRERESASELREGAGKDAAIVELVDRVRGYDAKAALAWID